jgi:hypothetical protein
MPDSTITGQIASLAHLAKPALSELWRQLFKKDPPSAIRRDLLQRIVAHRLQEQEFGALSEIGRGAFSRRTRNRSPANSRGFSDTENTRR